MRRRVFWVMGVLLFCAIIAVGYFAYQSYFTPEAIKRREVAKWVKIIGENTVLPENEKPTLATVSNKEKLRDQVFFLKAENGDKVLIYPLAGQAFLYRPSMGKVIDMTTDVEIERE